MTKPILILRCNPIRSAQAVLLSVLLLLAGATPAAAEEKLTLNFTDTDITAVIGAVAKLTGKNFIIDPRVKGRVTVITHTAMSKDEAYQVFLSLLKVHGYSAIPTKNAIKIVPEVNAKQDSIPTVNRSRASDGDRMVTQVIPIKYVNAAQLVPILRPLVPQRGHLAAYTKSNVLIISDSAANVARLAEIIRRIDLSVNDEVEVITLEHASASEIVRTVKQLKKTGVKDATPFTLVADERTNSILLSGDKHERIRLRALITHLDVPMDIGGNTHVIYLKYAKAKDLVTVLTGVSKSLGKNKKGKKAAATASTPNINIQADESSNALVINAPPSVLRSLRSVVRQLDIRRAQVMVEAILAEVSYEKSSELGVQWVLDGTAGGTETGPIGLLNFGALGSGLLGLLESPPALGDGLSFGFGTFRNGNPYFGLLLRTLAGDANTNVLSTPSLVTMDNEEATIVVGQNVPFITGSYANTGGGTTPNNPFQTIQRQDVGLTMKIKPQINEGDAVKLEIETEISSIASSTVGADLITNKRSFNTNVLVNDDQILVIGGLIEDGLREAQEKLPGLGDIPVIGWLFKYKSIKKVKTNLMAFIHPVILKDEARQTRYTARKYNYIRGREMETSKRGLTMFSDKEIPVMSEIEPVPSLPPRYAPGGAQSNVIAPPPTF